MIFFKVTLQIMVTIWESSSRRHIVLDLILQYEYLLPKRVLKYGETCWTCDVQVYSCVSKLVVYKDSCKAGILELQGSNGEKAYCFFLSRV